MHKEKKIVVSIIMNCHNGEKFLHQSVQSVINQSYKNWELIFFDNISQDSSLSILGSFIDKRIKIFCSENFLNLYHARNEALKKTRGKYICFLDTDDYWTSDKLEKQVNYLENNKNHIMVYSNFYTLKDNKKYIQNKNDLPAGNITKNLLNKYSICILTTCVKREAFQNNMFDKKTNIIGDFDFFIKLSCKYTIGCIQEFLGYYRHHDNNLSKKKLDLYIFELSQWIRDNNVKFKKQGISLLNLKYSLLTNSNKHKV